MTMGQLYALQLGPKEGKLNFVQDQGWVIEQHLRFCYSHQQLRAMTEKNSIHPYNQTSLFVKQLYVYILTGLYNSL